MRKTDVPQPAPTLIKPEWFDYDDHCVLEIFKKLALTYELPYRRVKADEANA